MNLASEMYNHTISKERVAEEMAKMKDAQKSLTDKHREYWQLEQDIIDCKMYIHGDSDGELMDERIDVCKVLAYDETLI